ncbi:MAG: methylthioribulose 1-phosphate dehydratase [Acidobacteria bacterium]|nr:MAG: methylthioribulose 1-phosphate dehydratase [Acidobacteriota bacterium]
MGTAVSKSCEDLADAGREFYRRGWVLGTSGNFSKLLSRDPMRITITASGLEKGSLGEKSFLELDGEGDIVGGFGKPSAETSIHLTIYHAIPNVGSVLHTHSVWGTILSDLSFELGTIEIEGYEMLKGLSGVTTHEHLEHVPIIENSQDYVSLAQAIENVIDEQPDIHGIYLHRHGLYTWGESVSEARRHIEIFEFLFEVLGRGLN